MSAGVGSSCAAFFCVTNRICLSSFMTSSRARTDFSRPTKSGTIICGKTTMSRRGSTGNSEPREDSSMMPRLTLDPKFSWRDYGAKSQTNVVHATEITRCAPSGAGPDVAQAVSIDVQRPGPAIYDFFADDHALDALEARKIEHGIQKDAFHDRTQTARPGLAGNGA